MEVLQSCHLYQHVLRPTRYRQGHEPSLLDLVLTNEEGMVNDIKHNPGLGDSDHECLSFSLDCYKDDRVNLENRPNYYKADFVTIKERLQLNWSSFLTGKFLEDYLTFMNIMEKSLEGCVPNYTSMKTKKNVYLTPEAVRLKNLKNKLWRRYKYSKTEYDHQRFKRVKNDLRHRTRKLRLHFEWNIVQDMKSSPKKFWAYVKTKTKAKSKIPCLKKEDGSEATTDAEKAEALNKFFVSTFTDETLDPAD